MTYFDEAITSSLDGNVATAQTHPKYANMVGPFGGITAATVAHAIGTHPQAQGRIAALTVNFIAPLRDGAYTLDLTCVQTNNSNQHWTVTGQQGEAGTTTSPLTATALLVTERGQLRSSEVPFPAVPAADQLQPAVGPRELEWTNNYQMRFVEGGYDAVMAGPREDTRSTYWLRHTDERPWDYASLIAACDSFFPRSFLRAGTPLPAGTITMTTYVSADVATLEATGPDILCTAHAQFFGSGLHDQSAHLWSHTGELLAVSHQLVYSKL